MISTKTYISETSRQLAVLSAFSAIDEGVAESLSNQEREKAYVQVIGRLSCIASLHGPDSARELIELLDNEIDIVPAIANILENGSCRSILRERSELQQEIVHFSRIIDIGNYGTTSVPITSRRLRRSGILPIALKVICELCLVSRTKIHRGLKKVRHPYCSSADFIAVRSESGELMIREGQNTRVILNLSAKKTRHAKVLSTYFSELCNYLAPRDAFNVLAAYIRECREFDGCIMELFEVDEDRDCLIRIDFKGKYIGDYDSNIVLPAFTFFDSNRSVSRISNIFPLSLIAFSGNRAIEQCLIWIDGFSSVSSKIHLSVPDPMGEVTIPSEIPLPDNSKIPILSLELAHLHLNRPLGIDQDFAIRIGRQLIAFVKKTQSQELFLAPMVDDDHVLISTKPNQIRKLFNDAGIVSEKFEIIPESSPIIRAIVVAIYHLKADLLNGYTTLRGNNLYLTLPTGVNCELFEDFHGRCDNGCVFFEVGLLLYRSAPQKFKEYFSDRFSQQGDPHAVSLLILDEEIDHDAKVEKMREYYRNFKSISNPFSEDIEWISVVEDAISECSKGFHLNVLEDYYESQQDKVRDLVRFLEIPLKLVSLHFNAFKKDLKLVVP